LSERGQLLVVAGLGSPCWDVAAAGDAARNFYVWGAMGGACMVALGLAMARREDRVLAIVGDGEMLMGMSSLSTIAARRPANLAILVLDNERYGETGNQPTHTAVGVDIAGVARCCGFALTRVIASAREVTRARSDLLGAAGPVIVVGTASAALVLPPRDGPYLKNRFRHALLGEHGVPRPPSEGLVLPPMREL
jgi:thiamine pyrophosphate-dependent acetolactate synthase large subunit-like protein